MKKKNIFNHNTFAESITTHIIRDEYMSDVLLKQVDSKYLAIKSGTGMGGTYGTLSSNIQTLITTPNTSQVMGKLNIIRPESIRYEYIEDHEKGDNILGYLIPLDGKGKRLKSEKFILYKISD